MGSGFLEPAGQGKAHSGEGDPSGVSIEISQGHMIETAGFEICDSLLDDSMIPHDGVRSHGFTFQGSVKSLIAVILTWEQATRRSEALLAHTTYNPTACSPANDSCSPDGLSQ